MKSMPSYAQEFLENYGVRFDDVCLTDVEKDMTSSDVLAVRSRATSIRFITASGMMIKHQIVQPLIFRMDSDAVAAKTLGTTHSADVRLYTCFGDSMLFKI